MANKHAINDFPERVLNTPLNSPEYVELQKHFNVMLRKAMRGRICTPERMAALYPIFEEINAETDELEREASGDDE